MIVQLHWQNPQNVEQTEFVAQGEFATPDDVHAWASEIIARRASEMPAGWGPLICTEDSHYFALCATEASPA